VLQGLGRDFAFAARRLLATPMFTAFAILSLAFGVGVTTAVYSVVDSIFWKETGIRDPETALFITAPDSEQLRPAELSQPDFDDVRASQKSFSSVGASQQALISTVVACFVPSSGGQWVIQGYVTVTATNAVGAPVTLL
jgi:hypothetical protein